ncbi:unnamed protein product [Scytosiphon promiscuus]
MSLATQGLVAVGGETCSQQHQQQEERKDCRRRGEGSEMPSPEYNSLKRVVACLAEGRHIDSFDVHGRTPLFVSCALGHVSVTRALLKAGAKVNLRTPYGTPLEVVLQATSPNPALVRELVRAGVDLGCPDPKGYLPIQRAAATGQSDILRELLSSSGISSRSGGSGNGSRGPTGSAACRVDLDSTVPQSGRTALVIAARAGHVEAVQTLLGAGASSCLADKKGWTALHFAAWKGHLRVVWELLGTGAKPSPAADKRWTPLLAAALAGHSEIVRQLIGAGASVEEASSKGWNSLHMASQAGHADAVRALLAAGANTEVAAQKGWTPLMTAATEGHGEIVDELVGVGADVDARNDKGCTALIMAAHNGYADVVRSLLEAGADTTPSVNTGGDWTALAAACAGGHDVTAKYLLQAGAEPDQRDDFGRTLLHDAAEDCRWDIARELLRAGADPDAVTDAGETPLSLAGLSGGFEVIRELLRAGAAPLAAIPRAAVPPRDTPVSDGPTKGVSPSTTSTASTTSSTEKWRTYRFKAETALSGIQSPGVGGLAPADAPQLVLRQGAKQGKHHPLLLELRRNTAPPEFPGSRRRLSVSTPKSSTRRVSPGAGSIGFEEGSAGGQARLAHSSSR